MSKVADDKAPKNREAKQEQVPTHTKKVSAFYPLLIIALAFLIYYFSRYIAGFFASIYPLIKGMETAEISAWFRSTVGQFWAITLFYGTVVLLVGGALKLLGSNFKAIGLKKPKWADISYALAGFAVYFILFVIISLVAKKLFPGINFDQKQQLGFTTTRETSQLILVFFSLVVAPPIAEEILCRGFIYTGLRKKWPIWLAMIVTSILFAVAHLQFGSGAPLLWVAAIDTFALSLVLVLLREKTDSLSAPILLHVLKNGLAFTLLFVIGVR